MKGPKDMFSGGIQSTRVTREETGARRIITMSLYFHIVWLSATALPTHRPKRNPESEGLQHLLLNTDHIFVIRRFINLFPNELEGQRRVSADKDTCAKLDDMSFSLGLQDPCGGKKEHLISISFFYNMHAYRFMCTQNKKEIIVIFKCYILYISLISCQCFQEKWLSNKKKEVYLFNNRLFYHQMNMPKVFLDWFY